MKMDKMRGIIQAIAPLNLSAQAKAQARLDNLTKPRGSLGRLEEIAIKVSGITGKIDPCVKQKVIFTVAADHGVAEEGVSAFPAEVTVQMVHNFLSGGAAINVLAKHQGIRVVVVDMGVKTKIHIPQPISHGFKDKKISYGTKNMAKGPAMTRKEALNSIEAGIDVFEEEYVKGIDIVGTGEMGIANTTAAAAIAVLITGRSPEELTGRGTGIDDETLLRKISTIKKAILLNNPGRDDAVDILSKVGGFEIGGLTGIILAAAAKRIPIVVDGFISSAAALIAYKLEPKVSSYMIASHSSAEKGHKAILEYLGLEPLLNLGLRLGEGTGAALGIGLIEAGLKIMNEMATFESAGVSNK